MAQQFFITKGSTLPRLRMRVIQDGRYDFRKLYAALQNADVTFTMWDRDTGVRKISHAPASVVESNINGCEEQFVIEYAWTKRDTSVAGSFLGQFKITFGGDLVMDGMVFPDGEMVVPIAEDLIINISDAGLKT